MQRLKKFEECGANTDEKRRDFGVLMSRSGREEAVRLLLSARASPSVPARTWAGILVEAEDPRVGTDVFSKFGVACFLSTVIHFLHKHFLN